MPGVSVQIASSGFPDSGWYLDAVRFAQDTPWLHPVAVVYTTAGFVLLALLLLAGGLHARRSSDSTAAAALAAPVGVLLALGAGAVVKAFVGEVRPCDTLHVTATVLPCDPPTDYAFPSNHSVVAAALAIALLVVHRRLGWTAVPFALLLGASRVYVGAHYPHDVVVGLLVGAACALAVGSAARTWGGPAVRRLRRGPLGRLLGPGPATAAAAEAGCTATSTTAPADTPADSLIGGSHG